MTCNKLFIGLLIILLATFFHHDSFAETSSIVVDSFSVDYQIDNGMVEYIVLNPDFFQLVIKMETYDDGVFEITIPRMLLDAKFDKMDDVSLFL